jgi:MYXO-CTERM domain-containing protein
VCAPHTLAIALVLICLATPALADTVATFADPSDTGQPSLFVVSRYTLVGGWSNPGLTLRLPIIDQVWNDVTFTMTSLSVGAGGALSGGQIEFRNNVAQGGGRILLIEFDAAQLTPFGFGAAAFTDHTVTLSGPGIPPGLVWENQFFAFSFANPYPLPGRDGEMGYSASFTSSATPEPGSLVLLGLGLLGGVRRR